MLTIGELEFSNGFKNCLEDSNIIYMRPTDLDDKAIIMKIFLQAVVDRVLNENLKI